MMDKKSQEEFDRITSIPDLEALTEDEIAFLRARRAYLNPSQRLAYQPLNLFPKGEKKTQPIANKVNVNDLTQEELDALEAGEANPNAKQTKPKD